MNENLIEAATAISDALDYLFESAIAHLEEAIKQLSREAK